MLQFNELRITADGKHLIIDAQVQDAEYYDDVYLYAIIVDTQKTYSDAGPSSKPLFTFSYEDRKHVREVIDIDTISNNLFFVYLIASGEPAENTPCGMKNAMVLGVVYDKQPFYKMSMSFLNSLEGCNPPSELINFILRLKAIELALKTGNYTKAIELWTKFFSKRKQVYMNHSCGCHE